MPVKIPYFVTKKKACQNSCKSKTHIPGKGYLKLRNVLSDLRGKRKILSLMFESN